MMNLYISQPIQPARESFRESRRDSETIAKPTDTKVKGLVLNRIGEATSGGMAALLPSATAPRIMVDLLSAFAIRAVEEGGYERRIELMPSSRQMKRPNLRRMFGKHIPVGIRRCEPHGWINAWIQFLLYIPDLPDLFSFAPRSFEPFREFIDQYLVDQTENKPVTLGNGAALVRCLLRVLPHHLFKSALRIDLYEIFRYFSKALFPYVRSSHCSSSQTAINPECHLEWDGSRSLDEEMKKRLSMRPSEVLVAVRGCEIVSCGLIQRQYFSKSDCRCYDLCAFIERRPDAKGLGSYIAYVKVEGAWYQCDDDRITALRSNYLSAAIHRSVLLYYKRLEFAQVRIF